MVIMVRRRLPPQPWPPRRADRGRHPTARSNGKSRGRVVPSGRFLRLVGLKAIAAAAARARRDAVVPHMIPSADSRYVSPMCCLIALLAAPSRIWRGRRRESSRLRVARSVRENSCDSP